MTTIYRARIVLVAFFAALSFPAKMSAWDADVHYGLTLWLAMTAGFNPADSRAIAEADEGLDNSPSTGPLWNGAYIALRNDKRASLTMQMYHFPSYGPVPGSKVDQKDRMVVINSDAARELVEHEITIKRPNADRAGELARFGAALHALQDSWSHSGVPDIPFRCIGDPVGPDLSWGHPITRGGWYLHDADWTFLHDTDTRQMALETYKALMRFRAKFPSAPSRFPDLTSFPAFDQFIAAKTIGEKRIAFRNLDPLFRNNGETTFIARTTLASNWEKFFRAVPPCGKAFRAIQIAARQTVPIPSTIYDFVQDFLTRWIVNRDVDGAAGLVSNPGIGAQLGELVDAANGADTWTRRAMTMWLIADHGLVNIKGHGMPGEAGYRDLPTSPADTSPALQQRPLPPAGAGLSQLIVSPNGTPFTIAPLDGAAFGLSEAYAVLFQFLEISTDSIIVVVGREGTNLRVVRLLWTIS